MCVDICRMIFIDGQYKRCYADGGTGQCGSEEIKEKQGIIKKHIELRCAAVHIFLSI